jgi:hypothetical protein
LGAAASFRPLFFACCILRQCIQRLQHHFIFTAVHLIASHTLPPQAGRPPFAHTPPRFRLPPPPRGCFGNRVTSCGCAGLCTIVGGMRRRADAGDAHRQKGIDASYGDGVQVKKGLKRVD